MNFPFYRRNTRSIRVGKETGGRGGRRQFNPSPPPRHKRGYRLNYTMALLKGNFIALFLQQFHQISKLTQFTNEKNVNCDTDFLVPSFLHNNKKRFLQFLGVLLRSFVTISFRTLPAVLLTGKDSAVSHRYFLH